MARKRYGKRLYFTKRSPWGTWRKPKRRGYSYSKYQDD